MPGGQQSARVGSSAGVGACLTRSGALESSFFATKTFEKASGLVLSPSEVSTILQLPEVRMRSTRGDGTREVNRTPLLKTRGLRDKGPVCVINDRRIVRIHSPHGNGPSRRVLCIAVHSGMGELKARHSSRKAHLLGEAAAEGRIRPRRLVAVPERPAGRPPHSTEFSMHSILKDEHSRVEVGRGRRLYQRKRLAPERLRKIRALVRGIRAITSAERPSQSVFRGPSTTVSASRKTSRSASRSAIRVLLIRK